MGCSAAILACSLTRNLYGTSGNVFEDLLAPNEPSASRSLASAQCEPVSVNTGRLAARADELERHTLNFAVITPRFERQFSTWNPTSHAQGAYPQNCTVERTLRCVSKKWR